MNMDVIQNLLANCQSRVKMFSAETYERYDDATNEWIRLDQNPAIDTQVNSWLTGDGSEFTVVGSTLTTSPDVSQEKDQQGVATWFRKIRYELVLVLMSRFDYVRLMGISNAIAMTAMVPKSIGESYLAGITSFIQQGLIPQTESDAAASVTPVVPTGNRVISPFTQVKAK